MTIKQQGGIFGRNPTFNDVTTSSLTVNGDETITGSYLVSDVSANADIRFSLTYFA